MEFYLEVMFEILNVEAAIYWLWLGVNSISKDGKAFFRQLRWNFFFMCNWKILLGSELLKFPLAY